MSTIQDRLKDKENPYNTFGKDNFLNANTGEEVRMVTENWDSPLSNGGISVPVTTIDHDSAWYLYLRHIPERIILQDLTLEMFGNNPILIDRYYQKPYMVNSIRLTNLPVETLEFLLKKYGS